MGCDYGVALEIFKEDVWLPQDLTRVHWYRAHGEFYYSEDGDPPNPEEWSDRYSSDRVREYVTRGRDYVLVTLDDDCGGQFQAILLRSKEVNPDDYE